MLLGVAVGCGGHTAAQPTTATPAPTGKQPVVSPHWSGYMVNAKGVSYTRVTGTWTVPKARCTATDIDAYSTVWIGLGGYRRETDRLEQVGTDSSCDSAAKPFYFAWFELLPTVSFTVPSKVSAGDTITGTVTILASKVKVQVQNRTKHWNFARTISRAESDTSSAEWIVEAPYICKRFACSQSPLPNFGSVVIHSISATGNGWAGALATPAWTTTALHFAPCRSSLSHAAASPGLVSSDGSQFRISWIQKAERVSARTGTPSGTVGNMPGYG